MKPTNPSRTLALAVLCLFAGTASAHTGDHTATGFAGGLAHPLLGLDHLLAMIAVGLWAAQQGGRALWAVPAAFVAAMGLGGMLAWSGGGLPHVETALALSVLALGLLIATQRRWAVTAGMAIATAFALVHGYAHGLEMPLAASPARYAMGFMLATVCLHGVGIAGRLIGRRAMQAAGAAIAVGGLALGLGL
ncbi:MAG: HupE/UreJ family protein [Thiobacillus sp.]|nr:HupE/UreJ family protein [Thiobacillus sp.]